MAAIAFRSLEEQDLPLLADWLAREHVERWWREPSTLEQVRERYLPAIRGEDPTDLFVIAVDYLIGDRALTGGGIGTAVIGAFARRLFASYPEVDAIVVTPQVANRASCRVLEKSGFALVWTGNLESDDPADAGPAAMYVLARSQAPGSATPAV